MPTRLTKILLGGTVLLALTAPVHAAVSPLTATPTSVSLSYQKPSTAGPAVAVSIKATASTYFTVDQTSIPIWLTLSATSGTASSTGFSLTFTPSSVCGALAAGSFSGSVKLQVVGYSDLSVPVTVVIANPAPTLSLKENLTQNITWTQGSAYPQLSLTAISSNEPISFAVAPSVTAPSSPANWIKVDHTSAVAYNWGTPVAVTFVQQVFVDANVGDQLTGTVTFTPPTGSPIVVTITITVGPPSASITRLFPADTPTQPSAQSGDTLSVVVSGANFVSGPSASKTVVTLNGTALDTANVAVVSPVTLVLAIPADTYLKTAGAVVISVSNPNAGAAVTASLTVTDNPITYAITNSASFVQPAPGSDPKVAPYELISIFGDNFGPTGAAIVTGSADSYGRYPNKLTANAHDITVTFYKADGTTVIADAYLIFATAQQINAVVPSGVAGNTTVKVVVTYNGNAGKPFTAGVTAADPGVFTTSSSGTGQAAVLLAKDYSVNSASNRAGAGDTILIYLTGLGAPNSTAANTAAATAAAFPKSCISTSAYMGAVNKENPAPSPAWTTIDGAVVLGANLATNTLPPCMATAGAVTVTIGGKPATVTYAGFVADSIAGLYQINATVPTLTASATQTLAVSVGSVTSQSALTIATK